MPRAKWPGPIELGANLEMPEIGEVAIIEGFPHATQRGIGPVIVEERRSIRGVGTAFSFGTRGLWGTAKHVADELDREGARRLTEEEKTDPLGRLREPAIDGRERKIGCVYAAETGDGDRELIGGPLWASAVGSSEDFDTAVLWTPTPTNEEGKALPIACLVLDISTPRRGDEVLAIGYPKQKWTKMEDENDPHDYSVDQSYRMSRGVVEEVTYYQPSGLQNLYKGPKLQCSAPFLEGMSGGPVINLRTGGICAIASSGMPKNEHNPAYSTATLSWTLLVQHLRWREGLMSIAEGYEGGALQGIVGEWELRRKVEFGLPMLELRTDKVHVSFLDRGRAERRNGTT